MIHGTNSAYARGCRCESCRTAKRRYDQEHNYRKQPARRTLDRALLREALQELFPFGLTDQCPARRKRR